MHKKAKIAKSANQAKREIGGVEFAITPATVIGYWRARSVSLYLVAGDPNRFDHHTYLPWTEVDEALIQSHKGMILQALWLHRECDFDGTNVAYFNRRMVRPPQNTSANVRRLNAAARDAVKHGSRSEVRGRPVITHGNVAVLGAAVARAPKVRP